MKAAKLYCTMCNRCSLCKVVDNISAFSSSCGSGMPNLHSSHTLCIVFARCFGIEQNSLNSFHHKSMAFVSASIVHIALLWLTWN